MSLRKSILSMLTFLSFHSWFYAFSIVVSNTAMVMIPLYYKSWLINLNLTYKKLWTGLRSGFGFSAGKIQLLFNNSTNYGAIDLEMYWSVHDEQSSF